MSAGRRYRQWVGPVLLALPFTGACIVMELARHENVRSFNVAVGEYDRLRSVVEGSHSRQEPEAQRRVPDTRFHAGSDANLVAATMLATVKFAAVQRGLGISRAETHQASERAGLLWAGISAELTGPVAGLYGLIADIEAARPVLVIDELRIRSAGVAAAGPSEPLLVATLEIVGPMTVTAPQDQ